MKKESKHLITSNDTSIQFPDDKENEQEYRDCNDIPQDEKIDLDKYYDWLNDCACGYVEDFLLECDTLDKKKDITLYLVTGVLGLWNGKHNGGKVIEGLKKAIQETFQDYNSIYEINGNLIVEAEHHDGTNIFTIKRLSQKGVYFYYRHSEYMERSELCEKLSQPAYCRRINFRKEVYGC